MYGYLAKLHPRLDKVSKLAQGSGECFSLLLLLPTRTYPLLEWCAETQPINILAESFADKRQVILGSVDSNALLDSQPRWLNPT